MLSKLAVSSQRSRIGVPFYKWKSRRSRTSRIRGRFVLMTISCQISLMLVDRKDAFTVRLERVVVY